MASVPEDQRTLSPSDLKGLEDARAYVVLPCCRAAGGYCDRCDLLVGLDALHVSGVDRDDGGALTVTVESAPEPMGCRACGVLAHGHGRREVVLVDAPAFGEADDTGVA